MAVRSRCPGSRADSAYRYTGSRQRSATSSASAAASCRQTARSDPYAGSGTSGHTSTAPMRGCTPRCARRSTCSSTRSYSPNSASCRRAGSPTAVYTVRWWSASGCTCSNATPGAPANASAKRSMRAGSRPSLTFGIASTRTVSNVRAPLHTRAATPCRHAPELQPTWPEQYVVLRTIAQRCVDRGADRLVASWSGADTMGFRGAVGCRGQRPREVSEMWARDLRRPVEVSPMPYLLRPGTPPDARAARPQPADPHSGRGGFRMAARRHAGRSRRRLHGPGEPRCRCVAVPRCAGLVAGVFGGTGAGLGDPVGAGPLRAGTARTGSPGGGGPLRTGSPVGAGPRARGGGARRAAGSATPVAVATGLPGRDRAGGVARVAHSTGCRAGHRGAGGRTVPRSLACAGATAVGGGAGRRRRASQATHDPRQSSAPAATFRPHHRGRRPSLARLVHAARAGGAGLRAPAAPRTGSDNRWTGR